MYLQAIILIIHIILNQYIFYSMQVQFDVAMDLISFIQLKILKLFHNYSFYILMFLCIKVYNQC